MKVANTRSSTHKLKRLFNVLLGRERKFPIFLVPLAGWLGEARCCERQLRQLPDLDSATPKQFGCDELAN